MRKMKNTSESKMSAINKTVLLNKVIISNGKLDVSVKKV